MLKNVKVRLTKLILLLRDTMAVSVIDLKKRQTLKNLKIS